MQNVAHSVSRAAQAALNTKATVIARIERLPANSMRVHATLLIGSATFFDGFDVIAIAAALPLLIMKWGLSPAQVGFLIASSSLGQLAGVFLFPSLAERFGRVPAIAWSSGLIGLTSIASGFAPTFYLFVALRTLQGLGLGGEVPVAATYINEISNASGRGKAVLLYDIVFPIGLLAANAIGALIVPRFGWEALYFLGGLPLILLVLLPKAVPESPRWLAERGRMDEADTALRRFEASQKGTPLEPLSAAQLLALETSTQAHPQRRKMDIFAAAYLKRTVTVAFLWSACGAIQYGLQTWLPTIYRTVYHAPLQVALGLSIAGSLLTVVGGVMSAFIVDTVGRKPIINLSFLLCALSLALAGFLHEHSVYLVATLCALAFGFMGTGFITAIVYTPELYPTSIRAFGCGVASAWLKIAAILAPVLVGNLMALNKLNLAFYLIAAVPLISAIAIHILGIETKGKILEQLEV